MPNEVKLLELKPNPQLLDAKFDGYKLSLEPISKIKFSLTVPPHKVAPSEEQYSSLHAQLFSLQNHLVRDPWATGTAFFVDTNRNVQCVKYNEQTAKLDPLTTVFKLRQSVNSSTVYNISFTFISEKYCVLTDGLGVLHLIDTGDRFNKSEWKSVFSDSGYHPFFVQDAKFEISNGTKSVSCILLHIEHVETSFESVLNFIQLKCDDNGVWRRNDLKDIRLKNLPTYCSIEPRSSAIVLCTDRPVNLNSTNNDETSVLPKVTNQQDDEILSHTWSQQDDDISIKFKLNKSHEKCNFTVTTQKKYINITYLNESLLKGKLFGEIDDDLTTWSLESDSTGSRYMHVTLMKKESSQTKWTNLLADQDPSEVVDNEMLPEEQRFGLTSVLQSEMEDCDMDIDDMDNDYNLLRIDTTSFQISHKLNIGSNRPLFPLLQRPNSLPAIVIRSDVDALIWVPKFTISNPSDWTLTHEATLNAFGYVQASKQQKKYIHCSPSASYAIICEPHRHVFIYKMNNSSAVGLKKRSGGKVSIGQQKLFSLEEQDEIVGMAVEDEITILLTAKYIFVLQINA